MKKLLFISGFCVSVVCLVGCKGGTIIPPQMSQTPTSSITRTALTPASTATATNTLYESPEVTGTSTVQYTAVETSTDTPSITCTETHTEVPLHTATCTATGTLSGTFTETASPTATRTGTITRTPTRTHTITRTITLTSTLTPTPLVIDDFNDGNLYNMIDGRQWIFNGQVLENSGGVLHYKGVTHSVTCVPQCQRQMNISPDFINTINASAYTKIKFTCYGTYTSSANGWPEFNLYIRDPSPDAITFPIPSSTPVEYVIDLAARGINTANITSVLFSVVTYGDTTSDWVSYDLYFDNLRFE